MVRSTFTILIVALIGLSMAPPTQAGDTTESQSTRPAQIQWFGTWEAAKAEAKRTGRPILLTAAACNCGGISGMW